MEADGAPTPIRRRKTRFLDTGSPEPNPLAYSQARERTELITPSSRTADGLDEGYVDPPRTKNSAVRIGGASPTSSMLRTTQNPQVPIVPRRQLAGAPLLPGHATRKIAPLPDMSSPKPGLLTQLKQMHWLFLIGLGMIGSLILWLVGSAVLSWGMQRYYDVRYGNPRTFQIDQVVGHGDSPAHPSHFLALNLNNHAMVIELKAGDPAKIVSYDAPITIMDHGQSPVTVNFKDVNRDSKLDMIVVIHLPGQEQYAVFINDGEKFRPATNNDTIHT